MDLLINCDDVGMHPSINRAVCDLVVSTPIRSLSLMANGNFFDDAVVRFREHGIRNVGVHLALTSEFSRLPTRPVSSLSPRSGLVDELGYFFADPPPLVPSSRQAVEDELRAQIERVLAAGLHITHLDGHMFFYEVMPPALGVDTLVSELAAELNVPYRHRAQRPTTFVWEDAADPVSRTAFYDGFFTGPALPSGELILHPADDPEAIATFSGSGPRRHIDYLYFKGPTFQNFLARSEVRLITWSDVPR
jgi:predicted glycoside hydrolase/deacetylase ChbG (UPF0249 family)